jgi:hypothetical protein
MREDRFGELWQHAGPLQDNITVDTVAQALREVLRPEIKTRAGEMPSRMELNGAHLAAERLASEFD